MSSVQFQNLAQQLKHRFSIPTATEADIRMVHEEMHSLRSNQAVLRDQPLYSDFSDARGQAELIAKIAIRSEERYAKELGIIFDQLKRFFLDVPQSAFDENRAEAYCRKKSLERLEYIFKQLGFINTDNQTVREFEAGFYNSMQILFFATFALDYLGKDHNDFGQFRKMMIGARELSTSFSKTPNPFSSLFFLKHMKPFTEEVFDKFNFIEGEDKYTILAKDETLDAYQVLFAACKKSFDQEGKGVYLGIEKGADSLNYYFEKLNKLMRLGLPLYSCPAGFTKIKMKLQGKAKDVSLVSLPDALFMICADAYSILHYKRRVFGREENTSGT